MKSNHLKFVAVIGFVVLLFVILGFEPTRHFTAESAQKDAKSVYKSKCAACHKAKAEKSFDPSKPDEQLVEVVLKGKKDAKPPMPGFESKGINAEQAKALVDHMRSLRPSGNSNTNTK
jgi:mono/diheme cytochrome c family protein